MFVCVVDVFDINKRHVDGKPYQFSRDCDGYMGGATLFDGSAVVWREGLGVSGCGQGGLGV